MCSFLFCTSPVSEESNFNQYMKRRGPDLTNEISYRGNTYVHNLLSITGGMTPQPLIQEDLACMFNGEIYNYNKLSKHAKSEAEALLDAYSLYGLEMFGHLDGEFSIVIIDYHNEFAILSSDVFGTKPMWVGFDEKRFACASYASALRALGFEDIKKIRPNETWVVSIRELKLLQKKRVTKFNLNQYKESYDDWFIALENAISKRTRGAIQHGLLICLSSGYDSGAIACALEKQHVPFKAYSFSHGENVQVLQQRFSRLSDASIPYSTFKFSNHSFTKTQNYLEKNCEDHQYEGYRVLDEGAAVGLGYIFGKARNEGYKIVLSGQGADEILSDYGYLGESIYWHSKLKGVYPKNLNDVFPWPNFFYQMQERYLAKEEAVAGTYGIETRYPFLDKLVVQEFLSLSHELKNKFYKAPLFSYLNQNQYPMEVDRKRGFTADLRVKGSLVEQARNRIKNWLRSI